MTDTLLTMDADETAALDLLETKIIAVVEQLQTTRASRDEAEAKAARLQEKIEELEKTAARLQSQNADAENVQKTVRSRVESLIERIESIA